MHGGRGCPAASRPSGCSGFTLTVISGYLDLATRWSRARGGLWGGPGGDHGWVGGRLELWQGDERETRGFRVAPGPGYT